MPFPWRDSASHGSISALANAAVPTEVQNALATRMGPAAADSNSNDFQELLEALVSPPSSVFFRYTSTCCSKTNCVGGAEHSSDCLNLEASVKAALLESEQSAGCQFLIQEAPPPIHCPEARLIVGHRHQIDHGLQNSSHPMSFGYSERFERKECSESQDATKGTAQGTDGRGLSGMADFIIDAACAMAVLRGSDVFCMGVMAASPRPLEGQLVRLWVVPEGVRPPNRGSVLSESPSQWPAVLIAGGRLLLPRSAIFACALQGPRGTAVRVLWRRGSTTPLASMNQVLSNDALQGKILLQQLPSCLCTRVLRPCAGHAVLDMCAAPGGKTTHIAQMLGNAGLGLTAVDRSLAKVRRIEALCAAHGFQNVRCLATDSRHLCSASSGGGDKAGVREDLQCQNSSTPSWQWPPEAEAAFKEALAQHGADRFRSSKRIWKAVVAAVGRGPVARLQVNERLRSVEGKLGVSQKNGGPPGPPFQDGSFDRILLDPPCSAMGQRPLLRWGKSLSEIQSHADYQRQFLSTASRLLSPGGELVYSTCTLTPQENEENVAWALQRLPLQLLDAREHVLTATTDVLRGLPGCGLSECQRELVLRFDPRHWDAGFFIARFARVTGSDLLEQGKR